MSRVILCMALLLAIGCADSFEDKYPSDQELKNALAGELISKAGTFLFRDKDYRAEYGTLTVLENRQKADSRLISLPVVRLLSDSKTTKEAVFFLSGGPGASNIISSPDVWLLKDYDLVLVGYRGVDGSVDLSCPAVGEAYTSGDLPLSEKNLKGVGKVYGQELERLKKAGVDLDSYTMLDVIEDLEDARRALGYENINLFSESYGTRLAYLYGLRYPEKIHRSLMVGVNPPGHFIWEPEMIDDQLEHYAELWNKDPKAMARTPDILKTMRNVLGSLPNSWMGFQVDPDKVKMLSFMFLYHRSSVSMVLDAFVSAEEGDYAGLALLSFFFDMMLSDSVYWCEAALKALSADYDVKRDYFSDMDGPATILGSPMGKTYVPMQYSGHSIELIDEHYRKAQPSNVETLMVNGNLDFSTPVEFARDELLPLMPNAHLVTLSDMGHCGDVENQQPEAFRHLAKTFFATGVVDDSKFKYQAMDFTPQERLSDMAYDYLTYAILAVVGLMVLIVLLTWFFMRRHKRKRLQQKTDK